MPVRLHISFRRLAAVAALIVIAFGAGCVSKSKAQDQARIAYLAGQLAGEQQAHAQQQPDGPGVRFIGQVDHQFVPWTEGMTLARAIAGAGYYGAADPRNIVVHRDGQDFPVDPRRLLNGEDFPVQSGDLIELQQ